MKIRKAKDIPDKGPVKKISLKTVADTVKNVLKNKKKPFGSKGGRKRKPTEEELRRKEAEERLSKLENEYCTGDG